MKYTGEQCPSCGKRRVTKCDEPGYNTKLLQVVLVLTFLVGFGLHFLPMYLMDSWSSGDPDSSAMQTYFSAAIILACSFWVQSKTDSHRKCLDCDLIWKP